MKDNRRTLEKHIYETLRQNRIPFFIGMKGIGKHYAMQAYCEKYKLDCVVLKNELPSNKDKVYICDDFSNETFIRSLCDLLEKEDYRVCFIHNDFPAAYMYALVTLKIELFYANEFMFSLSDSKVYFRKYKLNEKEIIKLYEQSLGNIYVMEHLYRYSYDKYLKEYITVCKETLGFMEQAYINMIGMFDVVEEKMLTYLWNMDLMYVEQLCKKGFLVKDKGQYKVPAYISFYTECSYDQYHNIYTYYKAKQYYAKAYRYAYSKEDRLDLYKNHGINVVLSLKENELINIDDEESSFIMQVLCCFRLNKQDSIKELLEYKEIDEDYMLAMLLLEDISIEEWISKAKQMKLMLYLPPMLFVNGFFRSRLFLKDLLKNKQLLHEFLSYIENAQDWFTLFSFEEAIESMNIAYAKQLLNKMNIKEDCLEVQFIKALLICRLNIVDGYRKEMIEIPEVLMDKIYQRDDVLTQSFSMFEIEKAVIFNQKEQLSFYYGEEPYSITDPYGHLLEVSILFRLKKYEKAMSRMNVFMKEDEDHSYMISYMKYIYALCLMEMHKETEALKMLSESLQYNGPMRHSSFYSYFGQQTIDLMKIYIGMLKSDVKAVKKQYHKAISKESDLLMDYHAYINVIIKNAKSFIMEESNTLNVFTPQELKVLNYLKKGYTNQMIADAMDLRISTVKTHISNLFTKLGVKNRVEAIKAAVMSGK